MAEIVYLNGKLVPAAGAKISVADHGLLYGYGLFQTARAYRGRLFLLERHLERLYAAAEVIGLRQKLAGLDLEKACLDTLQANKLQEARVRLTVTNGESPALPWVDASGPPNVIVTALPYTPFTPEKYAQGFKVGIASLRRLGQSVVSSMKSINYLLNVIARMETAAQGLDETVLLNDEGYIAEGGGSNIFFVREGGLVTPSVGSGIIPGVTREVVMDLADGLGLKVTEGTVGIGVFRKCREAFMTNALIEVMPVVSVRDESGRDIVIGDGKPGEITLKLAAAYRKKVEKEILNPNI
ncbi:MAG: aminotransferase class IV [Dehalococcoidales bacterium]|jgi:branched-chain amino acid aminotransferase group I